MEMLFKHNVGIDVEVFPLRSAVHLLSERLEPSADLDPNGITDGLDYAVERLKAA